MSSISDRFNVLPYIRDDKAEAIQYFVLIKSQTGHVKMQTLTRSRLLWARGFFKYRVLVYTNADTQIQSYKARKCQITHVLHDLTL